MPQLLSTRIDVGNGRIMVDGLGVQRMDNSDFISNDPMLGSRSLLVQYHDCRSA